MNLDFNLSEATGALQDIANGFVERVPYILLALVVFGLFMLLAKVVRVSVQRFARGKNTANEKRRLEYDVGVGYGDDIAKVKSIMLETVRTMDEVLQEPAPEALVVALAESSVNIRLRWWVQPPRQLDVFNSRDVVLEKVSLALHEAGVDLPFPTRQILFHDQTETTDGDRRSQREGWPAPRDAPVPKPVRHSRADEGAQE